MSSGRAGLREILRQRFPIIKWVSGYSKKSALADLVAGCTVGLTVMPQGLAYASLAGLQTQFGLYSAWVGCMVYAIFGGCKDITIGPTALLSLMTFEQVVGRNSDYAVLLCFLSGCVMLLMAPLGLGVLVELISEPVTVGFTSATAVIIVGSQAKGLLGLSISPQGFIDTVYQVALNIHNTSLPDAAMGVTSIVILLVLRKIKDWQIVDKDKPTKGQKVASKALWLLSIARNALVVLTCSLIAYFFKTHMEQVPVKLTGEVVGGLPPLKFPPFSTQNGNTTVPFTQMVSDMGSAVILVPIIAVLGNIAIAKAFAKGGSLDAGQELLTLGLANLLGSFVSSMPVTGSFSRSAVNHASGVATPLGGVYTGAVILLALGLLTPYFYFIPKASLAAVIISAVIFMIDFSAVKTIWKSNRIESLVLSITFFISLFIGVELGILAGVLVHLALLLAHWARPPLTTSIKQIGGGVEYTVVTPSWCLFYPGVGKLRTALLDRSTNIPRPIVLDLTAMRATDYTTANEILAVLKDFQSRNEVLLITNASTRVLRVLTTVCGNKIQHFPTSDQLESKILDMHKGQNGEVMIKDNLHLDPVELKQVTSLKPLNSCGCNGTCNGCPPDCSSEPLLHKSKPLPVLAPLQRS